MTRFTIPEKQNINYMQPKIDFRIEKNELITYNRWVSGGTPRGNLVRPLLAQSTVVPKQAQRAGQLDTTLTEPPPI